MKKILTIVGATALLATPALANSAWQNSRAQAPSFEATRSYAAVDGVLFASPAVIQGDYSSIGMDPDPNVRLSLQRDNPTDGAGQ